jgi:hypothetical protein
MGWTAGVGPALGPPILLSTPQVKRPGRETDLSTPSSEEIKNNGAIPPQPHKARCFTFTFCILVGCCLCVCDAEVHRRRSYSVSDRGC